MNVDNVDADLIRMTIHSIMNRFPTLTFEEFNLAYSESVIEKKQGHALTRDELIMPIDQMDKKKKVIVATYKSEKLEIEEKQEQQKMIREKYLEARQLYFDSMGCGVYKGDIFQAAIIMENFTDIIPIEKKLELLEAAKIDYKEAVERLDTPESLFSIIPRGVGLYENGKKKPDCHYFLALRVINYALQMGFNNEGWKFIEK